MWHYDNPDCNPAFVQATISQFESEISDLKNRLEAQEIETQKANSKFEFSISEQEKLKKGFESEKKAWADENIALINRAEKAEAALAETTAELSGLNAMYLRWSQQSLVSYSASVSYFKSFSTSISIVISSPDFAMQAPGAPISTRAY